MTTKYKTINDFGSAQIIEKKSKFISNAAPVENEEQAQAFIEDIRKKYYDARHNCYAYIVGEKGEHQKFSDDGEPGGTAGRPIYDVIKGEGLTNTVIVVTRYFGGILLGTGGLVRAYGKSAKEGIYAAGIAEMIYLRELTIICDYNISGKMEYAVKEDKHILKESIYTDKVTYKIMCEYEKCEEFAKKIKDISKGNAEYSFGGGFFTKIVDGKICQ